eukprot:CAMPEP_0181206280 /NCGR_PEP_ID=MMETSP1096-20121128/20947_1 /TAXON_ID=156174 ORGANISM="Chrysochromulina ericina, Strain CCMP281" /NCGR_SAMPLE_ID=MMETSP1096 /ASSEMBLY_ACC=CAM_ASM_000453 /LENGTH=255 /DNA_ID=CAMNT_0023297161 /DNA_START=1 /DNA_END=768 /DNA_ORIENTATION=-
MLRAHPFALASAAATTTAFVAASADMASCRGRVPEVHLKYFEVQGVAETARHLMALGGVTWTETSWPVDMSKISQGVGVACPAFATAKAAGELDKNLGRAPIIIVDEQFTLAQSKPIERYLARRLDMMGASDEQAAEVDAITEHVRDVKDMYQKAKGSANKEVAVADYFQVTMPEMMMKLERAVSIDGGRAMPLVGGSLSLADVSLFVFVMDFFDDKASALASVEACPRLLASLKAVGDAPEIKAYRAKRTAKST